MFFLQNSVYALRYYWIPYNIDKRDYVMVVRTSQQMSDEHDRRMTAIELLLHRFWRRVKSCDDGCRMFADDRDRGNLDGGDDDQEDNEGGGAGGGKTDRDGLMSGAATSQNSHAGYEIFGAESMEPTDFGRKDQDGEKILNFKIQKAETKP